MQHGTDDDDVLFCLHFLSLWASFAYYNKFRGKRELRAVHLTLRVRGKHIEVETANVRRGRAMVNLSLYPSSTLMPVRYI